MDDYIQNVLSSSYKISHSLPSSRSRGDLRVGKYASNANLNASSSSIDYGANAMSDMGTHAGSRPAGSTTIFVASDFDIGQARNPYDNAYIKQRKMSNESVADRAQVKTS